MAPNTAERDAPWYAVALSARPGLYVELKKGD